MRLWLPILVLSTSVVCATYRKNQPANHLYTMKTLTSFVLICAIGIALSRPGNPDTVIFPTDDKLDLFEDSLLEQHHEDGYHIMTDLDLVFNIADGNKVASHSAAVSCFRLWLYF